MASHIDMFMSTTYPYIVAGPAPVMNAATISNPIADASATNVVVTNAITAAIAACIIQVTGFTLLLLS